MTIYEECRLLKKTIIDSVFEKMAHPRQAKFLQNPKYQGDPRWIEECQSIYITSARYQNEWFYNTFKTVVTETYNNKSQKYNFFAGDIFLAILYGLKTKGDYFKSIKLSGELDTRMEDLNEMIGEAENPFFTRTMFHSNQIIKTPFVPPSIQDIMTNNIRWSTPKQDGEYRLLYIDYAFANSIANGENDNTVIGCMRGYLDKEKGVLLRGTDYVTTHESSDTNGTDRLIRELFWWYQCDYIVLDLRNGGETNYNHLTEGWVHPELPQNLWNPHGFTVCEELDLQVVQNAKIEDLRKRTIDPQAIPCIIPIIGTDEFNSAMWLDLQKRLRNSDIGFLIDSTEFEENFDEYNYTEDERLKIRLPFVQTSLLVNEAVNLSQEWRSGKVRLTEPRTGTKDRIVALGYGNYIMTLLETKLLVQNNQGSDYNDDDWSFLAGDTSPSYGYYYPY